MAPLTIITNLATIWRHLHWLWIWPPDGTTCIDSNFGHQVMSHYFTFAARTSRTLLLDGLSMLSFSFFLLCRWHFCPYWKIKSCEFSFGRKLLRCQSWVFCAFCCLPKLDLFPLKLNCLNIHSFWLGGVLSSLGVFMMGLLAANSSPPWFGCFGFVWSSAVWCWWGGEDDEIGLNWWLVAGIDSRLKTA